MSSATVAPFNVVHKNFDTLADGAGINSWDRVHHWNASLAELNPRAAFDWNQLVPVSKGVHRRLHIITTGKTEGIQMFTSPVFPSNRIPLGY